MWTVRIVDGVEGLRLIADRGLVVVCGEPVTVAMLEALVPSPFNPGA